MLTNDMRSMETHAVGANDIAEPLLTWLVPAMAAKALVRSTSNIANARTTNT